MIKTGVLFVLFSNVLFCVFAQEKISVQVKSGGTFTINGKTNINSFKCTQDYTTENEFKEVQMDLNKSEILFTGAELLVPVSDFDCGHKIMTRDFQEILESENNPYLKIKLNSVNKLSGSFLANVSIRLAGVSRKIDIPITVNDEGKLLTGQGECEVTFSDFNLEPPVKFMGMVKVKEELIISFKIMITQIP